MQDITYTNTWYLDVTLPEPTEGDYSSIPSSAWHPALFDEGSGDDERKSSVMRVLRDDTPFDGVTVSASATQADILAIVDANENAFAVFKQGSANAEPRNTSENGTDFRIYFRPRDSSNPNNNGRSVFLARFEAAAIIGKRCRVSDIIFQRSGIKDMVGVSGGASPDRAESFRRCLFRSPGNHAMVVGATQIDRCRAVRSWGHRDNYFHGGAFHQFFPDTTYGQRTPGVEIRDSEAEGFSKALYSHGSGEPYTHESYTVDGFVARDCSEFFTPGSIFKRTVCRRVRAYDIEIVSDVSPQGRYFEDCEFYGIGTRAAFNEFGTNGTAEARRCFFVGFPANFRMKSEIDFRPISVEFRSFSP